MSVKIFLIIFLLIIPFNNLYSANYGKVAGRVTDAQTGEPLAGANVYIENSALGASTDKEGYFVILQVSPGNYGIISEYIGYNKVKVEEVKVSANRIATLNIAMPTALLETESVVVVADRPIVEKDITATARSIDENEINTLPATTVTEVLRTKPGVVNSGGLHIRGGRSGEVVYYMDGVPLVNPLFSEINSSEVIGTNAISEMQVISGTFSAEYGNAMSGIINISTKEGTEKFNYSFDAKSSALGIEKASIDNNRQVIRGNISGPLFTPKMNFFVSGSYDDRNSYLPWGYRTEYSGFVKITSFLVDNLKMNASANYSQGIRKNYSHAWKYISDQRWYEPRTNSFMGKLGITHTLADNLFYNLMFYYTSNYYDSGDYDYNELSPQYRRDENKEFLLQAYVSTYEKNEQQTMSLKGDILWQANNYNEIKGGFEIKKHQIRRFYINSPYYDDHLLDDYKKEPMEASAYIQDKINFSSIILSAGIRFDMTDPNTWFWPSPYDAYNNIQSRYKKSELHTQISPRLGISYPVSEKTVFHFGYGHYFQRPEYQFIYKSISDQNYDQNIVMNLRSGNGRFGNPDLKPEKTIAYEFGVSHQLFDDYLINLSVYSKKITNLTGARTFFAGDSSSSGEIYWESFSSHINEDFGYNNGLEFQFRKIRGQNWFGEINYTYSVAEGSSSGPLERVGSEEANRQSLKFFPLDFDQRHSINANLTYLLNSGEGFSIGSTHPFENLKASALFRYGSGLPYTRGIRGATEAYEINNERLPDFWEIDIKIERRFDLGNIRLVPYLEIYNLTDRKNIRYVDPFTGKPDYIEGRTKEWAANPLNWSAPRLILLGVRFSY